MNPPPATIFFTHNHITLLPQQTVFSFLFLLFVLSLLYCFRYQMASLPSLPSTPISQEYPKWTPDHALDLLFHPDIIPVQVRRELHPDLHVCALCITSRSFRSTNSLHRSVPSPEQTITAPTLLSSPSCLSSQTQVSQPTKLVSTSSAPLLVPTSPLLLLTNSPIRSLLSAVFLSNTNFYEVLEVSVISKISPWTPRSKERSWV